MKRCRPLLGTFVEIETDSAEAIDRAFAAIERVHMLMSAHDPASELSLVNRLAHREPVTISRWTAAVVGRSLHWAWLSGGAFDIVRAGRIALARGALPRHPDQPQPEGADWTAVELVGQQVRLHGPACLDLGGIAKGFAVDRAIDALRSAGATRGLVNAGGDLAGFGPQPWPVTIVDPKHRGPVAMMDLRDGALATSAGLRGPRGALTFDHLPGADRRWTSVTVRASSVCDADALTKILWSGTPGAAALLSAAGAEAFAVRAGGGIDAIAAQALAA
ncbi:MAG: FAD:protein FMN transferase [Sphingomicrobium sp.]